MSSSAKSKSKKGKSASSSSLEKYQGMTLDELSQLFGNDGSVSEPQKSESQDDDNVDTTTVLPTVGEATASGAVDENVSAIIEIVDESLDLSSPTPGPADPLIIEMRGDVLRGDPDHRGPGLAIEHIGEGDFLARPADRDLDLICANDEGELFGQVMGE